MFKAAQSRAMEYNVMVREVNTDRGSQFYASKNEGVTAFQRYLDSRGIRHIPLIAFAISTNPLFVDRALIRSRSLRPGITGGYTAEDATRINARPVFKGKWMVRTMKELSRRKNNRTQHDKILGFIFINLR